MVYTDRNIWLDSENSITDRNAKELRLNEPEQENYEGLSADDIMEKEPAINIFLEILLNKRLNEVDSFLSRHK